MKESLRAFLQTNSFFLLIQVNRVALNWNDFGQTNKIVNYHTTASFVRGGLLEDPDKSEQFMLVGNAWKAYPLLQPYYISRNTRLKFQFSVEVKAQGHAVCVDSDAILSDSRKCIWLTGNEFERHDPFVNESKEFDLRRSKFVNLALGMPATQSSTSHFGISDARKAVDGYINPRWSDSLDIEKNSISVTNKEANAFWGVSLSSLQSISKVIIHEFVIKPLVPFVLKIFSGVTVLTIESTEFTYIDNVYTISLPDQTQGDKVRIELKQKGILALVEVLVLGDEPAETTRQYDIPIGEMILDGVSFGHPIWDGIKIDLTADDNKYTIGGSTDSHVRFDANHILTDILGEVGVSSQTDCTIVVHKDAARDILTMSITPSNDLFHMEFPPGIVGSEVEIKGCIPTNVQVFGRGESVRAGSAFDNSRPSIKYIALIQNSTIPTVDEPLSKSIFNNVELYDDIDFSEVETSKVGGLCFFFCNLTCDFVLTMMYVIVPSFKGEWP